MAAKKKQTKLPTRTEARAKQKDLNAIGDRFSAFKPARNVLKMVTAVPTIFAQFDHATNCGGYPIERFSLLHGPSNHGKTVFALGLMKSFLKRGHYVAFIDAEYTTPLDWVQSLMGDYAQSDQFLALRPQTYEETTDGVRDFCNTLVKLREADEIGPDTSGLIVVDSVKKLVPKNILARVAKGAEKEGVDGMRGMAGMIKAAMNAAWVDELTPLLARTRTALLAVERETIGQDETIKVGGGASLFYEASLAIRCVRAGYLYEKEYDADRKGPPPPAIGERHRIEIYKTKVAQKHDKTQISYFHTSNGTVVPEGFDVPRDVLEIAEKFGIVELRGSWYSFEGVQVGQGKMNAVKFLHENGAMFDEIEKTVRAQFAKHDVEEEEVKDGAD